MASFNKMKPLMILLLVLLIVAAGCSNTNNDPANNTNNSSNNGSENDGSNNGNNEEDTEVEGPPMVDGKYEPAVTMTTVKKVHGPATYKEGENADDNVHYRWVEENLGIKVENLWSTVNTNNAYDTRLKLMLSSNEELPDVLFASGEVAQILIESGKFREVGSLFDKYASETWKNAVAEAPTAWYEFTSDGKRYGIPNMEYDYNNDPILWLRQDWLDKVGESKPETLEDYEQVLDKFTNGDPDGDGEDNTYGLSVGLKSSFSGPFGLSWVFGAYGAMPEKWLEKDGKLVYGSVQPEIKEGLAKIKSWVQKGYIPMEAGIWDPAKAGSYMSANSAGSFTGPYWSEAWPMGDLYNSGDNVLTTTTVPVGPDGTTMVAGGHPYTGAIFINKEMEHPEIFFTYANQQWEEIADPEPGSEFENGWAEGYDWAKVDGKVTYNLNEIPGGGHRVFFYSVLDQGPRIPSQNVKALVNVNENGEAKTPYEKIWAGFVPPIELQSATDVWNQREFSVKNAFTGGTTPTMQLKWDYLKKLELQTYSDIVFGEASVDSFDDFIAEWNEQGGEQITQEVNEWYNSVTQ